MAVPPSEDNKCPLSDRERLLRATRTGGEPLLESDTTRNPYLDYEHIDVLLSLQQPRTNSRAEMSFYIMGQVKELLFKLLYVEFRLVRDDLAADRISDALWVMRRIQPVQQLLISAWDVLRSLSTAEFNEFRDELGAASGLQSFMYRRLEFILGNKDPAMVQPHIGVPAIADDLAVDLASPSVYDEAIALLARRGAAIPRNHLERDLTTPYCPHPAVEHAWAEVYRGSDVELRWLAEALLDAAYYFTQWRAVHLVVVEKMIGNKPGSGASSGLKWLQQVAGHRFFPELWSVRDQL
jgi:tryptophan 2,3-dioxygenase